MSDSYITMKSIDVKKLCEDTIQHIKNLRERDVQAYINERREKYIKRSKTVLGRLFKFKIPSDEQIRSWDLALDNWSEIDLIERIRYSKQHQIANRLLLAAMCANEIQVSVEDLGYIV